MTDHIWFIQAAFRAQTARSYVPVPEPGLDATENRTRLSKILHRARIGEPVAPEELPGRFEHNRAGRQTKLDIAIWNSAFVQVREDVAEIMGQFDLGATTLRPIEIALYGSKGVDTRYLILLTSNIRATIDPDRSEPIGWAAVKRDSLYCTKAVHPGVQALRSALKGPALWTDPTVNGTIFVNEELALALKAAPFARDLALRKICLGENRIAPKHPPRHLGKTCKS